MAGVKSRFCKNGIHEMVTGAFLIDGEGSRRCRECKRVADARRRSGRKASDDARIRDGVIRKLARDRGVSAREITATMDEADILGKINEKKWNLEHLKPKAEAQPALDTLHFAMEERRSNCFSEILEPSPWVDYDGPEVPFDQRDEPFQRPTAVEAAKMCAGCPVFDMCAAYAELEKPVHGVWAGVVWGQGGRKK